MPLRLLLLASPVAPLGAGATGGAGRHLEGLARALSPRGHAVTILAPRGSRQAAGTLIEQDGALQPSAAHGGVAWPVPPDPVAAAICRAALERQGEADAIVNFAHDWLPYFLTPFFHTPLLHIANLPALNRATDREIVHVSHAWPLRVGMLSRAQAATYPGLGPVWWLVPGIDTGQIPQGEGGEALVFAGRISPEKGLLDAAAAAAIAGLPLLVAGLIEDPAYARTVQARFGARVTFLGHLEPDALHRLLGRARAVLQTPKVEEAFGMVTIEALAAGTPVLAYDRGAAREIIDDGRTGFLVAPDDPAALAARLADLGAIDRHACRAAALARFSLDRMALDTLAWIERAIAWREGAK